MNKKSKKGEKILNEEIKTKAKKESPLKKIQDWLDKFADKHYIGYGARVIICGVCFLVTLGLSFFLLTQSLSVLLHTVTKNRTQAALAWSI